MRYARGYGKEGTSTTTPLRRWRTAARFVAAASAWPSRFMIGVTASREYTALTFDHGHLLLFPIVGQQGYLSAADYQSGVAAISIDSNNQRLPAQIALLDISRAP